MITQSLPPRIVVDVSCARRWDGQWAAYSTALPEAIAYGYTLDEAAEKLARLAANRAGEPVRTVVTIQHDNAALLARVRQLHGDTVAKI